MTVGLEAAWGLDRRQDDESILAGSRFGLPTGATVVKIFGAMLILSSVTTSKRTT